MHKHHSAVSQALGPGSGFTLEIANNGSGNRNQVVGDAIFHCHFYPHFPQGMWGLWRNHDVFEGGTHNFTVNGVKWLFETDTPGRTTPNNSGFRNSQMMGISEHFKLDVPICFPRAVFIIYTPAQRLECAFL